MDVPIYINRRNNNKNYKKFKHYNNKLDELIDLNKYITNLSSKTLTNTQKHVLALGLKYIPSSEIEPATTQAAFTKFQRGNRLKHYFKDSATTEHHPFKATSNWEPPKASRAIEQYLDRVEKGLDDLNTIPITSNLNRAQNIALRELANDPTLVIKSADKGSGIVVETELTISGMG